MDRKVREQMDGKNPCDVCDGRIDCSECPLDGYSEAYECDNYECFLYCEGTCILSLYDRCGAWKGET